ncbi:hypothetical protein INS49_009091 [Diaporthe citri]|uniref:uncharacterized protein n=1 Tax=Diaporthe citri TaxID=83186 RepID=UPI001C801732|nr:uncharacterized protein INS49_009091 [Diaporthe citri]KAG6363988.1 hypothetical protein INS49_009091 [Diaporthe citri]
MSAPLPDSGIDAQDAPPPYDAVSSPGAPADLPPEKAPLPDDVKDEADSALGSVPPPPFTVTPGTLILDPDAVVIRGAVAGGRPLYQLSRPLNGHAMSVTLMHVDQYRAMNDDDTMRTTVEQDNLYRIYAHRDLANMNAQVAEVSAQKARQFHGVRLKKGSSVGLTGVKEFFEATWGDDLNRKTVYQARQKKGVLDWRDGTDRLVAVDNLAIPRRSQAESLDILVSLDKRNLDFIVALWVARIWHDTQAEGQKEDKQDAKRRKAEQKQLDKEEGRPHGPVHDMKEALGIGYGVKGPSNGLYPGGMPGTDQSGQINWGGSKG